MNKNIKVMSGFNKEKHTISKIRLFVMRLQFWKYKEIIPGVMLKK